MQARQSIINSIQKLDIHRIKKMCLPGGAVLALLSVPVRMQGSDGS